MLLKGGKIIQWAHLFFTYRLSKELYAVPPYAGSLLRMKLPIIGRLTAQVSWFGFRVGSHLALSLHSSNELGELLQWL